MLLRGNRVFRVFHEHDCFFKEQIIHGFHWADLPDALRLVLVRNQLSVDGVLPKVCDPVHTHELVDRRASSLVLVEHTFQAVSCLFAFSNDAEVYFLRRDFIR